MLSVNPAECEPRQIYKLMTGIIVPRPVALVSTINSHGVANLAPFSFFSGVGSAPPTVLFCPALRPSGSDQAGERKDTLRNVEETGEFVINVVPEALVAAANAAAAEVAPGWTSFNWRDSPRFQPGRQAAQSGRVAGANGVPPHPGHLHRPRSGQRVIVLGEVMRFHLRADLVEDFRVDPGGLDAVGRMAGNTWVRTRDRIELVRPDRAPGFPLQAACLARLERRVETRHNGRIPVCVSGGNKPAAPVAPEPAFSVRASFLLLVLPPPRGQDLHFVVRIPRSRWVLGTFSQLCSLGIASAGGLGGRNSGGAVTSVGEVTCPSNRAGGVGVGA